MHYTMLAPMGRPRTRDFDLPPRMRRKGKAYYHDNGKGKWTPLGSDLARAKRKWADLEYVITERSVADLVDRYLADCCDKLADSTKRQYASAARAIRKEWGDRPCDALRTGEIARYRDHSGIGRVAANTLISVLRKAYAKGVEWEWAPTNPAAAALFNELHQRERYMTDAEFVAIRKAAPSWLVTAMDVAYLTGLRPCDVFALRWDQIEDRVTVLPRKTRKTKISISFTMTPELRAVLDAAKRRPVVGLYVVATDKGRPITVRRMQEHFAGIVKALGIKDCQFRDIRAKTGTDAEAQEQDAQAILHHSSPKMTARYLRHGQTKRADPLRRKL